MVVIRNEIEVERFALIIFLYFSEFVGFSGYYSELGLLFRVRKIFIFLINTINYVDYTLLRKFYEIICKF